MNTNYDTNATSASSGFNGTRVVSGLTNRQNVVAEQDNISVQVIGAPPWRLWSTKAETVPFFSTQKKSSFSNICFSFDR
jgi:hypothetical protein